MTPTRHLVVVAAAESTTSDALTETLRASFTVRTAYDGEDLRQSLDESVDVVVVDPDLPGIDPGELAEVIESRDIYCRVALLTSGDRSEPPTVADAALDVTAPVEELEHVTARMAARAAYQERLERLYELADERADLVARADDIDDDDVAELGRIENRIDRLRAEIRGLLARLDDEAAFETALGWLDDED